MRQDIKSHNNRVLKKDTQGKQNESPKHDKAPAKVCSCPRGKTCPLNGECFRKNLVYKATVNVEGKRNFFYVGQTSTTFKSRMENHFSDFKTQGRMTNTELSKCILKIKEQNLTWSISCEKLCDSEIYKRESKVCKLCMDEKIVILMMIPCSIGYLNSQMN